MLDWIDSGWVSTIASIVCFGFAARAVEKVIEERDRKKERMIEALWQHIREMEARAERREQYYFDKIEELRKGIGEVMSRQAFAERLAGIDKMTSDQMRIGNLLGLVNDVLDKSEPENEIDMPTR